MILIYLDQIDYLSMSIVLSHYHFHSDNKTKLFVRTDGKLKILKMVLMPNIIQNNADICLMKFILHIGFGIMHFLCNRKDCHNVFRA